MMKTKSLTWGGLSERLFRLAYLLGAVVYALALLAIWAWDGRFAATAAVIALLVVGLSIGATYARKAEPLPPLEKRHSQADTDDYTYAYFGDADSRRRERLFWDRVEARRPTCVMLGIAAVLCAAGLEIAAIWRESDQLGLSGVVAVSLAVLAAGFATDWSDW